MYTFLRMGVNDFKIRMKMYGKQLYFLIGWDFSASLRFGRNDLSLISYKQYLVTSTNAERSNQIK